MDLAQTPPKDLMVGTPPGAENAQTGATATTPVRGGVVGVGKRWCRGCCGSKRS